jgi:hypothetical protein
LFAFSDGLHSFFLYAMDFLYFTLGADFAAHGAEYACSTADGVCARFVFRFFDFGDCSHLVEIAGEDFAVRYVFGGFGELE